MSREEQVREAFDAWARAGRDRGLEEGHRPAVLDTFDRWSWQSGERFLDVGCGNGWAVRLAAERAPRMSVVGIDLAPEMIERARDLTPESSDATFLEAGLLDAPLASAGFDKVFSMETLYYMEDPGEGLVRIAELLRPGGTCALLMDYYRENEAVHHWPDDLGIPMTLLGEREWAALARSAGLREVRTDRFRRDDRDGWQAEEGTLRLWGVR